MNTHSPSPEEIEILEALRLHRKIHRKNYPKQASPHQDQPGNTITLGQRVSDNVARTVGSWRFIIIQSIAIVVWITGNIVIGQGSWDPYPFILLNLLLSFQAAYTAPAIMMSQNRQAEVDRQQANNDFEVNVKAELEIELLHQKIDLLKEKELLFLTEAIRDLSNKIEHMQSRS
jgi:uncharacterized membrane protein